MTEKTIRPGSIQAWFAAIRPKTWGVALAPIFIGISMARSETGHGRLLLGLLTIAVAVAIQALTNMENDVGYTKRKAEKGNRKGLPRATSEGWLTIQQVDRAILLTAIVVVAISLALVVIGGWVIFVLGALSVAAAYLYMGGPKPIAYTPWGELTVFIFFGLIAVNGTYYLQTGTISFISVASSCACGSIASSVLVVNNWRDAVHDESVGRRTLAVVLGQQRFPRLYLDLLLLPFIIVLLIVTVYPEHFLYLISLFAIRKVKGLYEDFRTLKGLELNQTLFNTVKLEMQFAILLTIGALLDALWHWVL